MAVKCILTGQTPSVLDGVTENVQTQLDGKESKISLTANRAVVVGADGKLAVSAVTSTELGYLDGVTSNIQTQLNSKLSSAPVTSVAGKTGAVTLAKGDVGLGNVDNTSDVNKPISTATQTALDAKQDKITATGLLAGDGNGGVTAAEETEVELVEITPDTIGAQSKITANGILKGDGVGNITATTLTLGDFDNAVSYQDAVDVSATDTINADTLGGNAASYFATKASVDTLSTTVNSVKTAGESTASSMQAKLDKTGGTMVGKLVAQANTDYATKQVRNIIISTSDPSGGENGDIWIKYTE